MANPQQLDVLAFGAHPDDVEIGAGGILHLWSKQGKKVGICDLTRGELSSNGTVERREQEAKKAGEILGLTTRINLGFPDRGITGTTEQLDAITRTIRIYQPSVVLLPYVPDRHPDHENCYRVVKEALFNAKIRRYEVKTDMGVPLLAHGVEHIYLFYINSTGIPRFYVDITKEMDVKMAALGAYGSQFEKKEGSVLTPLTEGYLERIRAREYTFGQECGVTYAEGFDCLTPLRLDGKFPWKGTTL